jgi:hypothetical protein
MAYSNPDGVVVKDKERSVIVRFKTEQDMLNFIEKTGIEVNSKIKKLHYPIVDITELNFIEN